MKKVLAGLVCFLAVVGFIPGFFFYSQSRGGSFLSGITAPEKCETPYVRQLELALPGGGRSRIGLYDQEAALEFAERQPLALQLEGQDGKIMACHVPPALFQRSDTAAIAPAAGDIVFDAGKGEVFICCRAMERKENRVLLGRVISGLENLSSMEGPFEVLALSPREA